MYDDDDEASEELRNELILGTTAHLLAAMGDEQAWLLIEDVQRLAFEFEPRGPLEDNGWGGTEQRSETVAYLEVEPFLQPRFTTEVQGRILPVLADVALRNMRARPLHLETRFALPQVDEKWREALHQRYQGEEVSNQGRRERLAPENQVLDGMTFTNEHEVAVYKSLVRLQALTKEERTFAIAPLPALRIRAGNTWTPDIVVLGNGRAMLIEVDGPQHGNSRRRADDDMRDHQWRRCRLVVRRVAVEYTRPERVEELDSYLKEIVGEALFS